MIMAVWRALLLCLTPSLCRPGVTMRQQCDDVKRLAEKDLIPDSMLRCSGPSWPEPSQILPSIDSSYTPQPPLAVCMDSPISYSHTIPSSGAHRPVGARSGDYLYCPPQRWVQNLRHGAAVLLYHPCASISQHSRLSLFARSCLSHYIITPFPQLSMQRPLAIVTWGRTLQLSHVGAPEACDWLGQNAQSAVQTKARGSYSLLLTWPADSRLLWAAGKEDTQRALRQCCLDTLSLPVGNRTARGKTGWKEKRWRRELVSQGTAGSTARGAAKKRSAMRGMKVQQLPRPAAEAEPRKGNRNVTEGPPPDNGHGAGRGGAREGAELQDLKTGGEDKGEGVNGKAEVRGLSGEAREESQRHRVKTHKETPPQPGSPQCVGVKVALPAASRGQSQWIPTPRTEEAAWAAAALGFLLVLLTLAVLHTRLYRHWRRPPSLYWHQPEQDHDSVAEVIRRRLKMMGQRRRKGTAGQRREYSLLPSSSSEESD
ncbi:tumor protein p53-inducible protein 13 isoform X2 [Brienomyrus brachyistius]|uniref:tumor protein p53-inducible protein 13 isoform X2 n=1 Tax=Brienomyrus brachyistius TaxID=42636 RepID=UPI0020B2D4A6|nr:tumor protein p53-inducible protein 13 isoform X2 [Brienomyrus brachyistius]